MRRMISLLVALLLCVMVACPVWAEDTFVPSIGYKDGPEIVEAEQNEEDVTDCLVVTTLKEAEEKTTDITQEDRDLLLEVYEELDNGSMELPGEYKDDVIRELVDVSFKQNDCVGQEHGHKEWLAEEGNTITITFDLGVKATTDVGVLVYVNGQWVPAISVVNNGDGTVTVELEDICPMAFCVDPFSEEPPATGDVAGKNLVLWIALMTASCAGIVVLSLQRRRQA